MSFQTGIFSKKELIVIIGSSTIVSVVLFAAYMAEKSLK